jgi:hypothetical protein
VWKRGKCRANQTIIYNQSDIRDIYEALLNIPAYEHKGIIHCPADHLVYYKFLFYKDKKMVLKADVQGSGCRRIQLFDGTKRWDMDPKAEFF